MKNININEFTQIKDKKTIARGHVTITDADGKIVVSSDNMIVESGRKFLLNKIFGTELQTLKYIYYGTNSDMTTPESLYIKDNAVITNDLTKADIDINIDNICYTIKDVIKYDTTNPKDYTITEIGLLLSKNATENETITLFSRVVHDPIPINANNQTYNVTYTIYF